MGSGASKQVGKTAMTAGRRQYPSRSSIPTSNTGTNSVPQEARPAVSSRVHPNPGKMPASESKTQHVQLDGRDPHFGAALRQLGPVTPARVGTPEQSAFPTSSQPPVGQQGKNIFPSRSPNKNASLMIVQTRERIAQQYEQQSEGLGRASFAGRTLISAQDIKEALRLRDEAGKSSQQVEKQMRLKPGIFGQLAGQGVVANA